MDAAVGQPAMQIEPRVLEGSGVRLEPVHAGLREEVREALDRDPDNWAIQSVSGMGPHFDGY